MNQPVTSLVGYCYGLSRLVLFSAGMDIDPIKCAVSS
jgi:hypothetical protein